MLLSYRRFRLDRPFTTHHPVIKHIAVAVSPIDFITTLNRIYFSNRRRFYGYLLSFSDDMALIIVGYNSIFESPFFFSSSAFRSKCLVVQYRPARVHEYLSKNVSHQWRPPIVVTIQVSSSCDTQRLSISSST